MNRRGSGASPRLVLLLAVACGAAVANLYYAQPLLHTLGRSFGVGTSTAGLLVTLTQIGYAFGLAFLVPLGDLLERRRLICVTLLVAAGSQALAAAAPDFSLFAAALTIAGVSSVVAQVIVPLASWLAAESERGRVVGQVMSGLLVGILLARSVSGVVAGSLGWRAIFWLAAGAMLLLSAALWRSLPEVASTEALPYGALLRSVLGLVREESVLRQRMALGGLAFGCFSVLWTSLAFLLAGPPYHYGNITIGLFGLAGLAGALIAPVSGRLVDRGHGRLAATGSIVILLGSWGLLALGSTSLAALLAGIVLLDLGAQALHISNQSTIYALGSDARSRLTTAYMVAYFFGGALASGATAGLYAAAGWEAVCGLGAGIAATALVVWLATARELPGWRRAGASM